MKRFPVIIEAGHAFAKGFVVEFGEVVASLYQKAHVPYAYKGFSPASMVLNSTECIGIHESVCS